jgi:hypothetical protein
MRCMTLVPAVIVWLGVNALAACVIDGVADHVVRGVRIAGPIVAGVVVGVVFGSSVMRTRRSAGDRARRCAAWSLRALERGLGQQGTRLVEFAVRMIRCTDVRPSARGGHLRPDLLDDGVECGTG